jgi:hypothetical protein
MLPCKIYNISSKYLVDFIRISITRRRYSNLVPHLPDRVLEKNIKILTLNSNVLANRKYTPTQYQLQCIGGSALKDFKKYPTQVRCINNGVDDEGKVNWTIHADFDSKVKFGEHYIVFEGYDKSEDEYVLAGSGVLRYNLEYINNSKYNEEYIIFFIVIIIILIFNIMSSRREKSIHIHKVEYEESYPPNYKEPKRVKRIYQNYKIKNEEPYLPNYKIEYDESYPSNYKKPKRDGHIHIIYKQEEDYNSSQKNDTSYGDTKESGISYTKSRPSE